MSQGPTTEQSLLASVLADDSRKPAELTEAERLRRFEGKEFTLEGVVPMGAGTVFVGRSPCEGPLSNACNQARLMMSQGKDITHVVVRDTRSWKPVALEKR